MATLSKHGQELGRMEFISSRTVHMTDGTILRDQGDGWRRWRKVKPNVDARVAFGLSVDRHAEFERERPAYCEYRKALFAAAGRCLRTRIHIHTLVKLMPGDPDGVTTELADSLIDPVHVDLDEAVQLCRLYRAMAEENIQLQAKPQQA